LSKLLAIWEPGWYALDQPLEIGLTATFTFWRSIPEHIKDAQGLVFYNTILHREEAIQAKGTICSIKHGQLGPIRKVETGLDYIFVLMDGSSLLVDAEEQPGTSYERVDDEWVASSQYIDNWRLIVEFESLSEPQPCVAQP
jgi:hypothetical protein